MRLIAAAISTLFFNIPASHSADPEPLPMPRMIEQILPAPAPIIEMGPLGPVLPGFFLPDRYAHWELMSIDRQGFYKPRVILAPQPYYLYNGKPYFYLPTRPQDLSNWPTVR